MLTAGIIGVNWGLVHLHNLRNAGVHVGGLCAASGAAAVAKAHGVAFATSNPDELSSFDLVVIASPPESHLELLVRFPEAFVICEKPVHGAWPLPTLAPRDGVFVNYAFGFLDVARAAQRELEALGPVEEVRIASRVALEAPFDAERWFLEVASHPLAWLLHDHDARPRRRAADADCFALEARRDDGAVLRAGVQVGGAPGIEHHVRIEAARGRLELAGDFRPGSAWRFGPVRVNGEARGDAEDGPGDPWLRANARSVEAMLEVARGHRSNAQGLDTGLFDLERAQRVERVVSGPLEPPP